MKLKQNSLPSYNCWTPTPTPLLGRLEITRLARKDVLSVEIDSPGGEGSISCQRIHQTV
jgi:hypothetical protein